MSGRFLIIGRPVGWNRRIRVGWTRLRAPMVTMSAVLASFVVTGAVIRARHLGPALVVQAVLYAWMLCGLLQRTPRQLRPLSLLVLPVAAGVAAGLTGWMVSRPVPAAASFVLLAGAAVWVRRFGPVAANAGTVGTFPLIAMLIIQGPMTSDGAHSAYPFWSAAVALIAALCALFTVTVGTWTGLIRMSRAQTAPAARSTRQAPVVIAPVRGRRRLTAADRMAAQLGIALGLSFLARSRCGSHVRGLCPRGLHA